MKADEKIELEKVKEELKNGTRHLTVLWYCPHTRWNNHPIKTTMYSHQYGEKLKDIMQLYPDFEFYNAYSLLPGQERTKVTFKPTWESK